MSEPASTVRIVTERTTDPAFSQVGVPALHTDERYLLTVAPDGPGRRLITLTAAGERGLRWARTHADRLVAAAALEPATYDEYPRFAVRGVVEGFYGRPWTHEQRRDMIRFLSAHRMNTFVYTPKDDVYTRRRWRDRYPAGELAELAETVRVATEAGVSVAYGISPGLSVRYGDPAEAEVLLTKLEQIGALGITDFLLLFDDVPLTLPHEADRIRYSDLVTAQVDLVDRVRRRLDAWPTVPTLTVCPTVYSGRGDEPGLRRLAAGLDARIDLLWTGRAICSTELDLADAATFTRTTARPPLYWDNYPVNDVAMTAQMHLGAYRGRDPHLYRFCRGVIANPMEHAEASKVALATIADYLWDPVGYDPEASWRAAARDVAGEDAEDLLLFADNVRTSCLEESDAHLLANALEHLEFEEEFGDPQRGRAQLRALAERFVAAADRLLAPTAHNQSLLAELRPWLLQFRGGADQILAMLDGTGVLSDQGAAQRPAVFGDVLDMFVRARDRWIDTRGS